MAKEKKVEKILQDLITDLFKLLEIEGKISNISQNEDHIKVEIDSSESGLLIGHHGETLNSLQLLLGVMLFKKVGEWVRVVLDVGGYRQSREENIKSMVERIVAEVEQTGNPVVLPYLSPLERRIVHMMLTDNEIVASQSNGEGRDRRVTIKLK